MSRPSTSSQEERSALNDELFDACSSGDLPALKLLLNKHDALDTHDAPPMQLMLQKAAEKSHATVLAFLLDSNPKIATDSHLASSAAWGGMEVYKFLLSKNPDIINWNFDHFGDAVIIAVKTQNIPFLRFLLDNGADPGRSLTESGRFIRSLAVEVAVLQSTEEIVRILVSHGAVLAQTEALQLAAALGRLGMIRCLLDEGADVNGMLDPDSAFGDPTDGSALHSAANGGHYDTVKFLLERGADSGLQDTAGQTALVRAQSKNHKEIVRMLELHGKAKL